MIVFRLFYRLCYAKTQKKSRRLYLYFLMITVVHYLCTERFTSQEMWSYHFIITADAHRFLTRLKFYQSRLIVISLFELYIIIL